MIEWKRPENAAFTTEELARAGVFGYFLNERSLAMGGHHGAWLWLEVAGNHAIVIILQLNGGSQYARVVGRDIILDEEQQEVVHRLLNI